MAPKRAPKQFMVGEVRCSITKDDNITVGLGGTNAVLEDGHGAQAQRGDEGGGGGAPAGADGER